MTASTDHFTRTLKAGGRECDIVPITDDPRATSLPYSLKILLENLLRFEDGRTVRHTDIEALLDWDPQAEPAQEIAFRPARVLLQDFTGVPAVVDLAAMRDAMEALGGDPAKINPMQPAELVIDHSVQVDAYGNVNALNLNAELEYSRNRERYSFLKWGQQAFSTFKVVPPDTGIVHQVNLEFLARTVFVDEAADGRCRAYPDTLVGTDSHTTMVNGLGVLGWGVGGIEAEAAMLGQPISMLIPQVVGFRLTGRLSEGATATDLVLVIVEMLRRHGVVGKFVEFFGDGLAELPLADRATIANMAPEYGATCGIFPIDDETLEYLRLTGRDPGHVDFIEAYARTQGLWREDDAPDARYTDVLELDLGTVEPSLAGPRRPQDRVRLGEAGKRVDEFIDTMLKERDSKFSESADAERFEAEGGHTAVGVEHQAEAPPRRTSVTLNGDEFVLDHGDIVIAAITSCTNTSNPSVMLGAGLVARKARERGLKVKPWVKTSLAPGSKVVTEYLQQAGLLDDLEGLGFHIVGYGCTTCIGNSGPLPEPISAAVLKDDLIVSSVLSGNRNFEGRIHSEVRMNFLASPPLVVAYALAGTMATNLTEDPIGQDAEGRPVYLNDIWPTNAEIQAVVAASVTAKSFTQTYDDVYRGEDRWMRLTAPEGDRFEWQEDSTYVRNPPYFANMTMEPAPLTEIRGARVLALLSDSVTTDHISPAGSIRPDSPAGKYLASQGVKPADFNSYGSRRGNHEVMMRGTFANVRLRNLLAPGTEGGVTLHLPGGEQMPIYDAAIRYQQENVPLIVIAGKEYGTGSSRDWAAKGTMLLGVKAVIVESFERIHRSNLIGMGVLPLQFLPGENATSLGLTGRESYSIEGLDEGRASEVTVRAQRDDGSELRFQARVRIDTPQEIDYFRHGGILHYVLRQLAD
ncbi:Aconitate hydratase; 2-methylisocitrate dehydratase [Thioalkalivibrio nitratireducens DSM 14787]|uniref:Aconitate hydratase n=1 Tax=Thioalkalivibrio nitratireducens (strain DSM 14787 / UNIQEM 213 / ALEN2) TaxID=1255043 RepID=L0DW30_THIND|nr:aconitate hydratase AcnA [Thioalkalivibrio nitratireducens]AGA33238.1 Aconitate hydratase; 2-methylisocitrate dehydratase [Thioalkalivibrio nitratireducens DSM 14787]